jgi:hypothetical protein
MAADPHDVWYVANTSWASADPDFPDFRGVKGQTRVRGSDPMYRKWPQFFSPLRTSDPAAPPAVEEAVAIPGRKRGA